MIKKLCIGLMFCLFIARAEQLIFLDERRVQQAVAEIMINRGIVLVDEVEAAGLQLRSRALGFDQVCSRNYSAYESPIEQEYSIHRLYSLGFLYLCAGEAERACAVWRQIALRYPLNESDEQLVLCAQDFLAQAESRNSFLVMRVLVDDQEADTGMLVLFPLSSSTILSSFLVG